MAKKKSAINGSAKEPRSADPKVKAVSLNYVFPPDQALAYSNNVTVQGDGSVYFITFFQVQAPLILGPMEEQAKIVDRLTTIDAKCVSRVVIPESLMPALIEVLQTNLERKSAVAELKLN